MEQGYNVQMLGFSAVLEIGKLEANSQLQPLAKEEISPDTTTTICTIHPYDR